MSHFRLPSSADRAMRRFHGGDAPDLDSAYHATGDTRPNSGLREGDIDHEEVNDVLRSCDMSVVFGQQTRLRNGKMLPDRRLPRFHAGHDKVKFFYGAIRQLPDYYVDALLEHNISVTLVRGPDLLVYHHPREHQAFHVGRTRRTLYLPESVLHKAWEMGYDYWALTEVLVQESWPLMDYLLIYEFVRRVQEHFKTHLTLGYSFVRDTLRGFNFHRLDEEERKDDEFRIFLRYYHDAFYELTPQIVNADPFDVTDTIYDESRERFWGSTKLHDIASTYRFPAYFHIDRDIVHGAAFENARKLAMSLDPVSIDDILHDLWDEARFKYSRSLKTEELLERLVLLGADGISAFVRAVADERTHGYEYITTNRYDGYDIFGGFRRLLQSYSSSEAADVPGTLGFGFSRLYDGYLWSARRKLLDVFVSRSSQMQAENAYLVRGMLHRVIEIAMHPSRAPEFKATVDATTNPASLVVMGKDLLRAEPEQSEADCLCEILARLDRHDLYHTRFLEQYRQLSGQPDVILRENIRPEVERLAAFLPDKPFPSTSDPQGYLARHREFLQLRQQAPDSKRLFELLAALFIRLDKSANYEDLVDKTRALGVYGREQLAMIAADDQVFAEDDRARIRTRAQQLLVEMDTAEVDAGK